MGSLDSHLKEILLKTEYDQQGTPTNMDKILNLLSETLAPLFEKFLLSKGGELDRENDASDVCVQ